MNRTEPWKLEPNFKIWRDQATGLVCAINRNSAGALCGYVKLPYGNFRKRIIRRSRLRAGYTTLAGKVARKYPDSDPLIRSISVHGGVTFCCRWTGSNPKMKGHYWVGFDCAHCNDLCPGLPAGMRVIPEAIYRDFAYVTAEVESLAKQVKERL